MSGRGERPRRRRRRCCCSLVGSRQGRQRRQQTQRHCCCCCPSRRRPGSCRRPRGYAKGGPRRRGPRRRGKGGAQPARPSCEQRRGFGERRRVVACWKKKTREKNTLSIGSTCFLFLSASLPLQAVQKEQFCSFFERAKRERQASGEQEERLHCRPPNCN